jgi:protein-arginine kinase activator protein McsA
MEVQPERSRIPHCHKCESPYKVFLVNGKPECKECYDKFSKRASRIYAIGLFIVSVAIWYAIKGYF